MHLKSFTCAKFKNKRNLCFIGKPVDIIKSIDDTLPLDIELGESSSGPSSLQSTEVLDSLQTETSTEEIDSLLNQEFAETGTVRFSVYNTYFKAMGFLLASAILLSLILMQTSRNMSDWWLSYWVTATVNSSNTTNVTLGERDYFVLRYYSLFESHTLDPVKYYLATYGIFVGLNSLFTLFRAFLFAYGGITAASRIHKMLLKSIIKVSRRNVKCVGIEKISLKYLVILKIKIKRNNRIVIKLLITHLFL